MKLRAILAAATLALMATPALAASTTVQFDSSNGQSLTVVFDGAGTATNTASGEQAAYTFDQAARKICSTYNGQEVCVTFDAIGDTVGFKTNYTNTLGDTGTATITAVTE